MREWTARRWLGAAAIAVLAGALTGIVSALLPNPWFTRMIEAPWWSYPVWIIGAALTGLLVATYLPSGAPRPEADQPPRDGARRGLAGSMLSLLAVGCPTCNKLVVFALGSSGAVTWFEPVQPVLAIGSVGLLGFALRARLRTVRGCPMPDRPVGSTAGQ